MLSFRVISRQLSDLSRKPKQNDIYVKPITGLKKYISNKFIKFIESYERILEKRFPKTFKIYRVFTIGAKDFYSDILEYFRISRELLSGKRVDQLNYNELMIYFNTPKDMARVGPVLLVSALPFANYVVFPLAYLMPKQLLSSHFWSLEQKTQFQAIDHTKRLHYYRPVFRHLQSKLPIVPSEYGLQDKCRSVFAKLGSGTHPSPQQLLELMPLFIGKPFGFRNLTANHLSNLCRMHGLNAFPYGRRSRLRNHIGFVRELDLALNRDGIESLNLDQMKKACFMRGLNPISLSKEEMMSWLRNWISIAQEVDSRSPSLLLHSPIFLSYNNPSNWRQIH